MEISLVNVYAPNGDEPGFIRNIFNVILQHSVGILLMGGDFNCILSRYADKGPNTSAPLSRMSKMLRYQTSEMGLVDVWRSKYPSSRDFTFYSHRHDSDSRIDYFFTPKDEFYRIGDIKILPITLSDHSPIEVFWDIGDRPTSKQ